MKNTAMGNALQLGDVQVDRVRLGEVCRRFDVKELALFGSALRGEMGPESDVDLIVEFEPGARIGIVKFESFIEELEALTGRRVDLVTKRGLKPWIRPRVLAEARVIYAR